MKKKIKLVILSLFFISIFLGILLSKLLWKEAYVSKVSVGRAINAVSGNVQIIPAQSLEFKSLENGYVTKIRKKFSRSNIPNLVKKNELVCYITNQEIENEIQDNFHQLEIIFQKFKMGTSLDIGLQSLKNDLIHSQNLLGMNVLSLKDFEKNFREVQKIDRQVKEQYLSLSDHFYKIKENIKNLENRKKNMLEIRSPIDGIIINLNIMLGQYIQSGLTIGKIISKENMAEINISEEDFSGIIPGQKSLITLLGYSNNQIVGKIFKILPITNASIRSRSVLVLIDPKHKFISSGMTGEARIIKGKRNDSLLIPRRSLINDFVLKISEKKRVIKQKVKVGFSDLKHVEILEGLNIGDLVITENIQDFYEGDRIKIRILSE
jgi:RND family efflux transporter MFP subunit